MATQTSSGSTPAVAAGKPPTRTKKGTGARAPGERSLAASPTTWFVWAGTAAFFIFLIGILVSVIVDSFGKSWFNSWLPLSFSTSWYTSSWAQFGMTHIIGVTLTVALVVIIISVLVGVPAAYLLARRNFPLKKTVTLLFLLPVLMPPITYGIPLATVMYNLGLGRTLTAVVLVNLVPSVPFVIMTMTPFVEQLDPALENAARMCGAGTGVIFRRILMPLLVPGMLAAGILVLVRTVGMFELTFLTSGNSSQTIVVALFNSMNAAGIRAQQSVDAMAVMYMLMMLIILLIALKFVNPTQLVARVKEAPQE